MATGMCDQSVLPHVLVCGGRGFGDQGLLEARLDAFTAKLGKIVVVTGACRTGADRLAEEWAHARRHVRLRFHPDWQQHGKAAGPIRNQEMVEHVAAVHEGFAVAFWDGKSKGTADCIERIKKHGIPLKIVRY